MATAEVTSEGEPEVPATAGRASTVRGRDEEAGTWGLPASHQADGAFPAELASPPRTALDPRRRQGRGTRMPNIRKLKKF